MNKIFSAFGIVLSVGWAKSWTWGITDGDIRRTYLLSFHIVRKLEVPAVSIIVGPLSIMVGLSQS